MGTQLSLKIHQTWHSTNQVFASIQFENMELKDATRNSVRISSSYAVNRSYKKTSVFIKADQGNAVVVVEKIDHGTGILES